MKTIRKTALLTICAILLVSVTVVGVFAYFTAEDEVTNTYTVANVKITLDEAKVNSSGRPVDSEGNTVSDAKNAQRVQGNTYHLLPGHTYTKDPTVTVIGGSYDCYVRLLVSINKTDVLNDSGINDFHDLLVDYDSSIWPCVDVIDDTANNTRTYVYEYYENIPQSSTNTVLPVLFSGISVPGELSNEEIRALQGFEINVIGQAHIDPDGFDYLKTS